MKAVPVHVARAPAVRRARRRAAPAGPSVYPPGWFSEPVRAWTQMRFESQMTVDERGHLRLLAARERDRKVVEGVGPKPDWMKRWSGLRGGAR